MTDRLTLTRALESSGMQSAAAERIATEIYDAIHDNVATKTDLRELEQPGSRRASSRSGTRSTPWSTVSSPPSSSRSPYCLARCTTGRRTERGAPGRASPVLTAVDRGCRSGHRLRGRGMVAPDPAPRSLPVTRGLRAASSPPQCAHLAWRRRSPARPPRCRGRRRGEIGPGCDVGSAGATRTDEQVTTGIRA